MLTVSTKAQIIKVRLEASDLTCSMCSAIAPSVQMILKSQSRLELGYRKQVSSSMIKTAPNDFFVRLEHNLFNVFGKRRS